MSSPLFRLLPFCLGTPAADGPHASVTAAVGSGDVEAAPAAQQARAKQVAAGGSGGGTTHWALTTFILLGDMFGLGCLTLPADFVRLGWLPALACLAAFALIDLYSGLLYQRLMIRMPRAVVFDQIGEAALGAVGKAACYLTIYLTIMGEPVIFHLTSAESLAQVFYASGLSSKVASVAVAAMVLPLAQVQHMHDVGWVAIIGTVGMLLSVAVVVGKLLLMYANRAAAGGPHPKTELVAHASFESAIVGVMDIVFTYGGQVNWMRYISTMRER